MSRPNIQQLIKTHMMAYLGNKIVKTSEGIKSSKFQNRVPLKIRELFRINGGLNPDFRLLPVTLPIESMDDYEEGFVVDENVRRNFTYDIPNKLIMRTSNTRNHTKDRIFLNFRRYKQMVFTVKTNRLLVPFSIVGRDLWLLDFDSTTGDRNGRLLKWTNYETNQSLDNHAWVEPGGIPGYTSYVIGSSNRLFNKVLRFTILNDYDLKVEVKEGTRFLEWFHLKPLECTWSRSISEADKRRVKINRLGINLGISSSETLHVTDPNKDRLIMSHVEIQNRNLAILPDEQEPEKYAVVVIAGEANAAGIDCSDYNESEYPENNRIFQLGSSPQDNLKIVPLRAYSQSFQNLDVYRTNNKPIRSLSYDLAKSLLARIPADYKLLVINAGHIGSGFTTDFPNGTCDPETLLPSPAICKWGLNTGYYNSMVERIHHVMKLNPENNIFLGMVWMQGESDLNNPDDQKRYFNRMIIDFENKMTQRWGTRRTLTRSWVYPVMAAPAIRQLENYTNRNGSGIWDNYKTRYPLAFVEPTGGGHANNNYNMLFTPVSNLSRYYGDGAFKTMANEIVTKMFSS